MVKPAIWKLENAEGLYCPTCKCFMPDYEHPFSVCPRCGEELEGWIDGTGKTIEETINEFGNE